MDTCRALLTIIIFGTMVLTTMLSLSDYIDHIQQQKSSRLASLEAAAVD